MGSIGPQLPPHLLARQKRPVEDEPEEYESKEVESVAAESLAKRTKVAHTSSPEQRQSGPSASQAGRRLIGPIAPPPSSVQPEKDEENSSSSDDEFGPSIHITSFNSWQAIDTPQAQTNPPLSANTEEENSSRTKQKPQQRADWMTAPPGSDDALAKLHNPSMHRARAFNTRKGATNISQMNGIASEWTETPEQKQQRLSNQVLGIAGPTAGSTDSVPTMPHAQNKVAADQVKQRIRKKEEEERNQIMRKRIEQTRGQSLVSQHRKDKKTRHDGEDQDDSTKRAFDWEKDMNSGTRISDSRKREMINRASDFSGRFSGGGFL